MTDAERECQLFQDLMQSDLRGTWLEPTNDDVHFLFSIIKRERAASAVLRGACDYIGKGHDRRCSYEELGCGLCKANEALAKADAILEGKEGEV